ncbi:MAG: hypothetical protein K8T90_19955 [Planctomycetes bacterium]|nr:hypothetical protein [Planctomycetota bacterium]
MIGRRGAGMRAAVAGAAVSFAAASAAFADPPDAARIRAARAAVFSRPEFRYTEPTKSDSLLDRILGWWSDVVQEFQSTHPVLFLVLLAGAGVLLVVILAHLAWTWRTARNAKFAVDDPGDLEAALRRLDPAPFRQRALDEAAVGQYDEAVRDLYTALLLTLDRRGAIRYAGHKAFLDYRIESSGDARASAALGQFADAYPPGSFGRRPPDPSRFEALVRTLDALTTSTAQAVGRSA